VNSAGQFVLLEDIVGIEDLIGNIQGNITGSFANTALWIDAWKQDSYYNAWITYASWHKNLKAITQIVELPISMRLLTYIHEKYICYKRLAAISIAHLSAGTSINSI